MSARVQQNTTEECQNQLAIYDRVVYILFLFVNHVLHILYISKIYNRYICVKSSLMSSTGSWKLTLSETVYNKTNFSKS